MSGRRWFESDGPLVPAVPAYAWVGETVESCAQMVDADGNVMMTIYAGAHPVKVKRLGPDMTFDWAPASVTDAQ